MQTDKQAVDDFCKTVKDLKSEIRKNIIGQEQIVELLLNSIFSNAHCLLLGVPGLAKTLLVNTVSSVLGLKFNRIQFTPDLMPADILGSEIFENQTFKFIKGPIFSNIILADEINRTSPKTQSALLEAMQEKKVTIGGKTYSMDLPFFVLATQNPIEQEGTYPLPEAQLDRFMFNLWVDYPSFDEELEIIKRTTVQNEESLQTILNIDQIVFYQKLIDRVPVNDNIFQYAVSLVHKTRKGDGEGEVASKYIRWGAGIRASQYLIKAAKTRAVMLGKYSPDIQDIKDVAIPILRHRIVLNYQAEADRLSVDDVIRKIIDTLDF